MKLPYSEIYNGRQIQMFYFTEQISLPDGKVKQHIQVVVSIDGVDIYGVPTFEDGEQYLEKLLFWTKEQL